MPLVGGQPALPSRYHLHVLTQDLGWGGRERWEIVPPLTCRGFISAPQTRGILWSAFPAHWGALPGVELGNPGNKNGEVTAVSWNFDSHLLASSICCSFSLLPDICSLRLSRTHSCTQDAPSTSPGPPCEYSSRLAPSSGLVTTQWPGQAWCHQCPLTEMQTPSGRAKLAPCSTLNA